MSDCGFEIPEGDPYKRLTERKTLGIMADMDYQVGGYVLTKAPDRICISYGSAVRWLSAEQMFRLMHDTSIFEPK